ncbi:MAG: helix-turn-helix domain-containing protein [Magnetococcales bacterium]|nr:helix-turn-helix domain-containing protein [Magnetococcales bacterium]MBF0322940.1 helix-turn-helix domain-containing protein [Magnetococcales bacterium]
MNDDVFVSIKQGMDEALAYSKGDQMSARETIIQVPDDVDVRGIRERLGLTQLAFAKHFGFAVSALRDWEQGRRRPERAARILLKVIEYEPEAVERALAH